MHIRPFPAFGSHAALPDLDKALPDLPVLVLEDLLDLPEDDLLDLEI